MPLKVVPLVLDDFDAMINHAKLYDPGEDLVAPVTNLSWKISTREQALERIQFDMAMERKRFLGDKSLSFMKVVDQSGDIVSIARWHYYPTGYDFDKEIGWDIHNIPEDCWPKAMNVRLHNFVLTVRDQDRRSWMAEGKPCWILMHMVTRPSRRGQGAAGMLIDWGVEQAEKTGAPAYLEAGAMGRPIYEKHGFQQVGDLMSIDLRPHGVDLDLVIAKMAYFPGGLKATSEEIAKEPAKREGSLSSPVKNSVQSLGDVSHVVETRSVVG